MITVSPLPWVYLHSRLPLQVGPQTRSCPPEDPPSAVPSFPSAPPGVSETLRFTVVSVCCPALWRDVAAAHVHQRCGPSSLVPITYYVRLLSFLLSPKLELIFRYVFLVGFRKGNPTSPLFTGASLTKWTQVWSPVGWDPAMALGPVQMPLL